MTEFSMTTPFGILNLFLLKISGFQTRSNYITFRPERKRTRGTRTDRRSAVWRNILPQGRRARRRKSRARADGAEPATACTADNPTTQNATTAVCLRIIMCFPCISDLIRNIAISCPKATTLSPCYSFSSAAAQSHWPALPGEVMRTISFLPFLRLTVRRKPFQRFPANGRIPREPSGP